MSPKTPKLQFDFKFSTISLDANFAKPIYFKIGSNFFLWRFDSCYSISKIRNFVKSRIFSNFRFKFIHVVFFLFLQEFYSFSSERWQFFYSAYPAFHIKHIREFWKCTLKVVHYPMMKNIRALWYHLSGTFLSWLKNMKNVPYVRISTFSDYIQNLESNLNLADPIAGNKEHPF